MGDEHSLDLQDQAEVSPPVRPDDDRLIWDVRIERAPARPGGGGRAARPGGDRTGA